MSDHLVPGRSCGDCNVCCHVFGIDHVELHKPPRVICANWQADRGCGIYETRPPVCRDFHCEWRRVAVLGDEWRPDRAGILLSVETEGIPPGYPPQGLNLIVTGSAARIHWPPFVELVGRFVEGGLPVFLMMPGPAGYESGKVFLNPALAAPVRARNVEGVKAILSQALESCLRQPKQKMAFKTELAAEKLSP